MIQLNNVVKSFKGFKAVDGVSLEIKQNEYVALLGPNGAGKTTLVEMIEGLQFPDAGMISIKQKNWKSDNNYLRGILGISLQETKFIDKLTVEETLNLFGSFYRLAKSRSKEIMQMVDLEEKSKTYTVNLSGGQRQKLALGVALLNNPEILMLDEPTTGLDPNARREIWTILQKLKKEKGTTLLLTTHYMEEAQTLCDRIIIMFKGKIMAQGTLNELLELYSAGEIIEISLNRALDANLINEIPGLLNQQKTSQAKYILEVEEITQSLPSILTLIKNQNLELIELECRKKTLDDLFVSMTGRRLDE